MPPLRFDYKYLQTIVTRDECILVDDLSAAALKRDFVVKFTCSCGESASKTFKSLAEGGGAFCSACVLVRRKPKREATCQLVYGAPSPMQNEHIKQKSAATSLEKYGVSHPSKSATVRENAKKQRMVRYKASQTSQASQTPPVGVADETALEVLVLLPLTLQYSRPVIYGWFNTDKLVWYVGETVDFRRRTREHLMTVEEGFHTDLKNVEIFKLYILEEPKRDFETYEALKVWLHEREIAWIRIKNSYMEGYNNTPGGAISKTDIVQAKQQKLAHQNFKVHLNAAQWYADNIGSLAKITGSFVVQSNDNSIDQLRLGEIVNKWRFNPTLSYLQIKENRDALTACGFTPSSGKSLQLLSQESADEKWHTTWKVAMLWFFSVYGHVNPPTTYKIPVTSNIPHAAQGQNLGTFIASFRDPRSERHHPKSAVCRMLLCFATDDEWQIHKLQNAMKYFSENVARVPQAYKFPDDFHVFYLRGYQFGAAFRNLLNRRHCPGLARTRFEKLRWHTLGLLFKLKFRVDH